MAGLARMAVEDLVREGRQKHFDVVPATRVLHHAIER
jgi:hypothetical protein